MAKKNDSKDAGTSEAGTGIPGPGPENKQDLDDAPAIESVEELEIVYPKLISAVRDEVLVQIGKCSLDQVKTNMPEFYERLVMEVKNKGGPNLNVPGFLLEVDDPVARGTLRAYRKLKGIADLQLPFVLPFKDKATKVALENYILRAEGSGNYKRAEAAHRVMKKVK